MLEKQVYLVDDYPGISALHTVCHYTVKYAVQYHQHANGQKLLAEVADIVTHDTAVGVHVGVLSKCVQTAVGKKFYCQRHVVPVGAALHGNPAM